MSESETNMSEADSNQARTENAAAAVNVEPGSEVSADPMQAELDKAKADASKFRDQLLRTAADFDNFRKRARKDVEDAQRKGLEQALLEVLPVSDNLERAVQAASQANDVQSIIDGIRMVLKSFEDAFSRLGVERVVSIGQGFDPGQHEAVQQVETRDAPAGTIVAEMMPGYRLGPKLLRAAMVSVARAPMLSVAPAAPEPAPAEDTGTPEPTA